jgi:hypothetical protein
MLENLTGNRGLEVSFVAAEMRTEEFVEDNVYPLLFFRYRLGFWPQSRKLLLGLQSRVRYALCALTQCR